MKRFLYLGLSLIILVVALTIFFVRQKKQVPVNEFLEASLQKRKFKNANFKIVNERKFKETPFRLLPFGDSALVFVDTVIYSVSNDLNTQKSILLPISAKHGNFYVYKDNRITAGLNVGSNLLYVSSNGKTKTNSVEGTLMNGIFANNMLYAIKFLPQKSGKNLLSIVQWNHDTNETKEVLNINSILSEEIKGYEQCLENVLEGNFFSIDNKYFGYYFYRGGYFLVYKNDKFSLIKTLINYPFVKFEEKNVEFGNGLAASQCQTDKDIYVQSSACSNGKQIFILSNVAKKGSKERCIDIYSFESFNYLMSVSLPNFKNELPLDILIVSNKLLVVYQDGTLVSYEYDALL